MLKTRINLIASLVVKCNIVLDIGSDHAKVSKILTDENKANRVIKVELNEGPLQNSIKPTSEAKYYNHISNIKSNGHKEIYPSFSIDVCIIAGMGGKTIVEMPYRTESQGVGSSNCLPKTAWPPTYPTIISPFVLCY